MTTNTDQPKPYELGISTAHDRDAVTQREAARLRRQLEQAEQLPAIVRAAVWLATPMVVTRGRLLAIGILAGSTGALAATTAIAQAVA